MSGLAHRARKRFSQNFLRDAHYIEQIAAAIDPRPGDHIVEIGPGQAAITRLLIAGAGSVDAIEIDRDLAAHLQRIFTPEQLRLHTGDCLQFDWPALAQSHAPLRIVGNLPYHISTPLLFALLPIAAQIRDQHFMLQKEVIDRMVAPPGSKTYGRLSAMLQLRYSMRKIFDVPPEAFTPAPQVTSAIVRMVPRPQAELPDVDATRYARVVTAAFGQRRKTLRNALSELLNENEIREAQVDPQARAETLAVDDFVRLARIFSTKPASDTANKSSDD